MHRWNTPFPGWLLLFKELQLFPASLSTSAAACIHSLLLVGAALRVAVASSLCLAGSVVQQTTLQCSSLVLATKCLVVMGC